MPKFGALDNKIIGDHTKDDFRKVLERQGFLCFFCGIPIVQGSADPACEATEEHLVPRSKGGVDFIWNIVAVCLTCNQLKLDKMPGEFLQARWSIAQLVDARAHKSTSIPFHKERVFGPEEEPELDDDGNLVKDHLEVAPFAGSIVRALSVATRMEPSVEVRRQLLRSQVNFILRNRLESAGQMTLQFDKPKPVSFELESAALTVKGMHVTDFRRQA